MFFRRIGAIRLVYVDFILIHCDFSTHISLVRDNNAPFTHIVVWTVFHTSDRNSRVDNTRPCLSKSTETRIVLGKKKKNLFSSSYLHRNGWFTRNYRITPTRAITNYVIESRLDVELNTLRRWRIYDVRVHTRNVPIIRTPWEILYILRVYTGNRCFFFLFRYSLIVLRRNLIIVYNSLCFSL